MAEGWKQVWQDILNTLRGRSPDLAEDESRPQAKVPIPTATQAEIETRESEAPPPATALVAEPPAEIAFAEADSPLESAPSAAEESLAEPASLVTSGESVASVVISELPAAEPDLTPHQRRLARLKIIAVNGGLAILVIVVLWSSVGSQLWARLTAPRPPAPDVVATFDGGQITTADVETHLKQLVPQEFQQIARSPETLSGVAQDMVTDELVRRWAAQRQPDRDQDFGHTMQHITEDLNLESLDLQLHQSDIPVTESEIQDYYTANKAQFGDQSLTAVREQIRKTLVSQREQGYIEGYIQRLKDNASIARDFALLDVPAPLEDDLRRYYEANLDQFKLPRRVRVDELQFPIGGDEATARRAADDALLKVRSGASFAETGQAISRTQVLTDTLIAEGTNDPAWDTAVFGLTQGETSDVFRAGDAFYIVRLNELQSARTQTLDTAQVRATVLKAVQQQKIDEWFKANASKTLFTLKGKQYTLGEFYQEYQELPLSAQTQYAGPKGMTQLAERLIERLLLVEDTYDQLLDVQNKPLVDEARLQVLKQMMHQEEVDDKIQVSDEDMQKFYDENIQLMALPPRARIRYIRIGLGASQDEAERARQRADEVYQKLVPGLLQQGADFATVAQEYSEDPETAANGGELPDWIGESDDILAEAQLHPFHEIVLTLQPNEISRPFTFGDSLYIVQVIERTEPERLTFEQAKPYIQDILTDQKHADLLTQLTDTLFKQSNVVIYQSVLEEYFKQLPTPAPSSPQP